MAASTMSLLESLDRSAADAWLSPSPRTDGHLTRQARADRMRRWGQKAGVHLHPEKLRHTHATQAIRRGVDVFTLQSTLGHSSSATTGAYVAANPADSSSLRLG
jgi:site-specific recombinase XerD